MSDGVEALMYRELPGAIILTFLLAVIAAHAAFDAPPSGARPMGMGEAFTAVADDGNAPMYNPAGLAAVNGVAGAFTRAAFFSGLSDPLVAHDSAHFIAYGAGVGFSTLADGAGVYRETSLALGYGLPIGERFKVGAMGKWLRIALDKENPDVVENPYFANLTDKSAVTFDLGVLATVADGLTVGVAGLNLIPADVTFKESLEEGEETDKVPPVGRIGVAYQLKAIAESAAQEALKGVLSRSLVAADVAFGGGTTFGVGAEVGVMDNLTGRVGYRASDGGASALTGGLTATLATGGFTGHLDYALDIADTDLKDNLTQRLSLRVGF